MNYQHLSAEALLALARDHDPLALTELWSRLLPALEPVARVSRNEPSIRAIYDTNAMLQTAFCRLVKALPKHHFATLEDVLRYAVAIIHNRRIALRQKRLSARGGPRESSFDPDLDPTPAPDVAGVARRHAELLELLGRHLPADVVALIEMRADLLSWREIGDLLAQNPDTLRFRCERALASFRERFPAHALFPDATAESH
ncbi:RNA polymerase sigma factor [Zavarzinella formosa]|uniref:RNA polymerase sigma factor n=1 Tax=Zavarzinella formosa TaxID=360055 RepID=UPI00036DC5E2|nr:sigma-70 family RNA polymerase sigma factor [Zavarzinella formosa]